jgi:hypothetical protein
MRSLVLSGATAVAILLTGCVAPSLKTIQEQMGPQTFSEPNINIAGGEDAGILHVIEAAVSVSSEFGFRHDASASRKGRVDIQALWKGQLVELKMRFQRREALGPYMEGIYITSMVTQPALVFLEKGGEKIERLFHSRFSTVIKQRGLRIFGDPNLDPELMD